MAVRGGYGLTRLMPPSISNASRPAASSSSATPTSPRCRWVCTRRRGAQLCRPVRRRRLRRAEPGRSPSTVLACLAGPTHTIVEAAAGNPRVEVSRHDLGRQPGDAGLAARHRMVPAHRRRHPVRGRHRRAPVPGRAHAAAADAGRACWRASRRWCWATFPATGWARWTMATISQRCWPICARRCRFPVLTGLSFGHIPRRVTIPFGAQATLVSDEAGFRLTMSGYPTLVQARACA
jgi:muramoyltetrapeptide carboxypeptidase